MCSTACVFHCLLLSVSTAGAGETRCPSHCVSTARPKRWNVGRLDRVDHLCGPAACSAKTLPLPCMCSPAFVAKDAAFVVCTPLPAWLKTPPVPCVCSPLPAAPPLPCGLPGTSGRPRSPAPRTSGPPPRSTSTASRCAGFHSHATDDAYCLFCPRWALTHGTSLQYISPITSTHTNPGSKGFDWPTHCHSLPEKSN